MEAFWELGYDAATVAQLKDAMGGLCSPSIYAAFGSKEQLFREAVALYQRDVCQWVTETLSHPDTRRAIESLLMEAALRYTTAGHPRGCLVDLATANFAPDSGGVQGFLREQRRVSEAVLRRRLEAGVAAGDLPPGTDTAAMAGFYRAVILGLSTQAQDGASQEALMAVAKGAMMAWDGWMRAGDKAVAP